MTSPEPVGDINEVRAELVNAFEASVLELEEDKGYYEAERRPASIGVTVPPKMRTLLANVGYPRLYVDAIAERQELQGFRLGGADEADEELWDWFVANNLDVESILGHTDALVHGRSYVTISQAIPEIDLYADPEIPIIRVEPPSSLYAEIDPKSRQVSRAIRVIYDSEQQVSATTIYLPDQTVIMERDGSDWKTINSLNHGLGIVPVVPIPNRTRLSDLYGSSQITPELKAMTDAAGRILMLMNATAELMGVPQRIIFGARPEELGVDPVTGVKKFDAHIARILGFEDPEGKAVSFQAAELRNFTDALQEIAKQVAAYTGLPPQYLSARSDNPASAEAIKASESRLVKTVERKNRIFGGSWEQVMRIAYKMMNGGGDLPPEYYRMESIWSDPSTPTYAAKADAASKLYANGAGVIPRERAWVDIGYTVTEREEMRKWAEQENPLGLLGATATPQVPGNAGVPQPAEPANNPTPVPKKPNPTQAPTV